MSETVTTTTVPVTDTPHETEAVSVEVATASSNDTTVATANDDVESSSVDSEGEKPKLVLAPLPKKSPWEETGVTEYKPLDLSKVVAAKNKKVSSSSKSRSKGTPSLTGKERWVPLDVDITVKDKIPDVSNANGGKGKKLKNKTKKDKPKGAKKTKGKDSTAKPKKDSEGEKKATKKQDRQTNKTSSSNGTNEKISVNGTTPASASGSSDITKNGYTEESNQADKRPETASSSNSEASSENGISAPPSAETDGKKVESQQRRFTPNSKPFYPRNANHHNNHGHGYHHQHNKNNHNNENHYHGSKYQRQRSYAPVMYQQNYTPSYVLVNEIVRQIQYYFSIENLSKDMFLKSQMNAQGYVPLALISRFHRMLNLSYGDVGLILAALRELKNSENSNVNIAKLTEPFENVVGNPLFQYALSSKVWTADESISEPKSYDTVEFVSDELELFKIEPINPIIDSLPSFKPNSSTEKHEQNQDQDQQESSENQENQNQEVSVQ